VGVEVWIYSFFNLGAGWGQSTPRPGRFIPGMNRHPLRRRFRVPGPVWTRESNLDPNGIRSLNSSKSLYRLSYPAPHTNIIIIIIIIIIIKGKFHSRTGHDDPDRKQKYSSILSLTSALDGVGWFSVDIDVVQTMFTLALFTTRTPHRSYYAAIVLTMSLRRLYLH
jgi:hypothetical protein